jgi:hypothetical protein
MPIPHRPRDLHIVVGKRIAIVGRELDSGCGPVAGANAGALLRWLCGRARATQRITAKPKSGALAALLLLVLVRGG